MDNVHEYDSGCGCRTCVERTPGNQEHSCFVIGSRVFGDKLDGTSAYPSMNNERREYRLRCGHCFREWWFDDANERPEGKCDARVPEKA